MLANKLSLSQLIDTETKDTHTDELKQTNERIYSRQVHIKLRICLKQFSGKNLSNITSLGHTHFGSQF